MIQIPDFIMFNDEEIKITRLYQGEIEINIGHNSGKVYQLIYTDEEGLHKE